MLAPKRTKYRKMQRGRNKGLAQRGNSVAFGDFGYTHRFTLSFKFR